MVSKSKWIPTDAPDEPVTRVASRAVGRRLELVWQALAPAARESDELIEHVHDLRVASRRAMAAMDIFDELLPKGRKQWFRRQVKRTRKAAGGARDLDVLGARMTSTCPEDLADACDAFRKLVRTHRQKAQKPIQQIHATLAEKGFKRRVSTFVDKIRYRGEGREPSIACFAQLSMRPVLEAFFAAAESDFSDTTALHEFRIRGKVLRYTMEIFAGAFAPGFRDELYPLVTEVQEKLGEINDHATALTRLHEWSTEFDSDDQRRLLLHRLMDAESDRLSQAQAKFTAWWTPDWAVELRRRFDQMLKEHAC